MKRSLLVAIVALLLGAGTGLKAQSVLDGVYIKEHIQTKKVVPYPSLREADVMWAKRLWQVIDMKEKINLPLYYPLQEINDRKNLFDVIRHGLLVDGSITAYSTGVVGTDDEFNIPLTKADIEGMLTRIDTTYTMDLDTGEPVQVIQEITVESADIKKFKIKEDWYFDKQRSEMYVRIVGMAPMIEVKGEDGEVRGTRDMFWLYFPECRYLFANYDVFNRNNDAARISYDDFFWKRQFNSHVVKEMNVYDRNISQYTTGIDHLLESERIKEEIFVIEHDLWSY